MYRSYYGLKGAPFNPMIKTENLFMSKSIEELFSRLNYLKEQRGLMLITADPGSGKTTALRAFTDKLRIDSYKVAYIQQSSVSTLDFYRQIDFKLSGESHYRKDQLFKSIQKQIMNLAQNQKKTPVIILDEAQYLKTENLTELIMLLNFEFDSLHPAIVILNGDATLRHRLTRPNFTALHQRFRIKYELKPLTKDETVEYIRHRFQLVGQKDDLINKSGYESVFSITNGFMRPINNLMEKTLMCGAHAKKSMLDEETVYKAQSEL